MNRIVKYLAAISLLLLHCTSVWAVGHNEFANLYPDCEDNEPSKIYEPNEWPRDLRTPLFPNGGDIEFLRYIYDQLGKDYPDVVDSTVAATDDQPEKVYRAKGVVMVHITVDRCGKAVNPVVMESVNEAYDKAALKLMENLPLFKPGALNGVRVKVGMLVPVKFSRSHLPTKYEWDSGGDGWSGGDDSSDSGSDDSGSSDDWGSGWGAPW